MITVCFIEQLCSYKSTRLLEQVFLGLGVCVCVCVVFAEACQLEDSSVVSKWGRDAVSSPPTLMFCVWVWGGRHGEGFCSGSLFTLSYLGLILIH